MSPEADGGGREEVFKYVPSCTLTGSPRSQNGSCLLSKY